MTICSGAVYCSGGMPRPLKMCYYAVLSHTAEHSDQHIKRDAVAYTGHPVSHQHRVLPSSASGTFAGRRYSAHNTNTLGRRHTAGSPEPRRCTPRTLYEPQGRRRRCCTSCCTLL
eukprot:7732643-Pyramimonas_sp.AAC.3